MKQILAGKSQSKACSHEITIFRVVWPNPFAGESHFYFCVLPARKTAFGNCEGSGLKCASLSLQYEGRMLRNKERSGGGKEILQRPSHSCPIPNRRIQRGRGMTRAKVASTQREHSQRNERVGWMFHCVPSFHVPSVCSTPGE